MSNGVDKDMELMSICHFGAQEMLLSHVLLVLNQALICRMTSGNHSTAIFSKPQFSIIFKNINSLRFLNSLMIMKDGHFGLQRFSKVDDPDDVSLLTGMGLFPPDSHYNEYVLNVVAYSDEV